MGILMWMRMMLGSIWMLVMVMVRGVRGVESDSVGGRCCGAVAARYLGCVGMVF